MKLRLLIYGVLVLVAYAGGHAGTGLVQEYSRSSQETLYDYYFGSCKASMVMGVDSAGVETAVLALTLEEGDINVGWGDEVEFLLRDGSKVTLRCADKLRRGDVRWRRFKNANIRYITCYYHIRWEQLELLKEVDCRSITLKTTGRELKRNLKDVKGKITKMCNMLVSR